MLLKVLTPNKIIFKKEISKLVSEGFEGSFGILPKHIDFVTKLIPSILIYVDEEGEGYIGIDEGILVKQENEILISVREAFEQKDLSSLREMMEKEFQQNEEEEKKSGTEMTKLEMGVVKSFYNLEKLGIEL